MPKNFYDDAGRFYMVYCPKCKRENWAVAVANGKCAWCGYEETPAERKFVKKEKK